jgi:O-antigen ligase
VAGRRLLGAGGLVGATALGAILVLDVTVGVALVAAAVFGAILWVDLRLAIALWVPLVFLDGIPLLNAAGKAIGVLLAFAWVVSLTRRRRGPALPDQAPVVVAVALLGSWVTASVAWSVDVDAAFGALPQWYAIGLVFLIVATAMADRAAVVLMAWAFVAGGVLSVLGGVVAPGLAVAEEGRFQGTAGDPNLLAVGLLPAAALALGLAAGRRDPLWRALIAVVVAVLAVGFVASGSRGGAVGALVGLAVALMVVERRRATFLAAATVGLVALAASVWLVPGAWERSPSVSNGSGRSDLWNIAWHVAADHPVAGVGLDNYPVVAGDYARRVGPLQSVDLIAEPHEAHNLYLQLLAEVGVVGLALVALLVGVCLHSAWVAARRFAADGDRAHAALARAVLVGIAAMLGSALFVSAPVDRRLWVLLALGPALRAAAHRPRESEVSPASAGR